MNWPGMVTGKLARLGQAIDVGFVGHAVMNDYHSDTVRIKAMRSPLGLCECSIGKTHLWRSTVMPLWRCIGIASGKNG
jgi:hypothetical protein